MDAIEEIKDQGEGVMGSPFEGPSDPTELAHFFVFQQIAKGQLPAVFPFAPSADPSASAEFNAVLSDLLRSLQQAWTQDPAKIGNAVQQMIILKGKGRTLIQNGVRPDFKWTEDTQLH